MAHREFGARDINHSRGRLQPGEVGDGCCRARPGGRGWAEGRLWLGVRSGGGRRRGEGLGCHCAGRKNPRMGRAHRLARQCAGPAPTPGIGGAGPQLLCTVGRTALFGSAAPQKSGPGAQGNERATAARGAAEPARPMGNVQSGGSGGSGKAVQACAGLGETLGRVAKAAHNDAGNRGRHGGPSRRTGTSMCGCENWARRHVERRAPERFTRFGQSMQAECEA
eukprot:scaffold1470_cov118-Isochrysis_galbana.AAC.10